MINSFVEILAQLSRGKASPLIVTGSGERCFCAGYDILEIDPNQPETEPLPDVRFEPVVRAVEEFGAPVIAAMNGDAYGGGLDLALACDLRVARAGIAVAMTPCRLGLVYSAGGIARFCTKLGSALTRRLFLTALPLTDAEAHRRGVVDELVDGALLMERSIHLAREITRCSPVALRGTRYTIAQVERGRADRNDVKKQVEQFRRAAFTSPDLVENLATFISHKKDV
jgi:enoyl-CoA hydratase/carnithine racemase